MRRVVKTSLLYDGEGEERHYSVEVSGCWNLAEHYMRSWHYWSNTVKHNGVRTTHWPLCASLSAALRCSEGDPHLYPNWYSRPRACDAY